MKKLILIFILFIPINIFAWPDKFDKQDILFQSSIFIMTQIDLMETIYTLNSNPNVIESNPFLNARPSQKELILFSYGMFIGHTVITYFIPKKYNLRTIWQSITIGSKGATIYKNFTIMTSLRF